MGNWVTEEILARVRMNSGVTVSVLLDEVSHNLDVKVSDTARFLHELSLENRIRLENPNPPRRMLEYVKSIDSIWFWLVMGTTVMTYVSIYLFPLSVPYMFLRYCFGSLFVLYLPGYVLVRALYPDKGGRSSLERLALSIGLSLAISPLLGLILNYTPWGIRLDPILFTLSLLTVSLATVALAREFSRFQHIIETVEMPEPARTS